MPPRFPTAKLESATTLQRAVAGSLLLHACLLTLLPEFAGRPPSPMPLQVNLSPLRERAAREILPGASAEKPARHTESFSAAPRRLAPARPQDIASLPDDPRQSTPVPVIDLDAARATSRALARKPAPRAPAVASAPQPTVESVVARVMAPVNTIETRGPAGERVTIHGKMRCVTPIVVPHYMEGMTIPTQCETRPE